MQKSISKCAKSISKGAKSISSLKVRTFERVQSEIPTNYSKGASREEVTCFIKRNRMIPVFVTNLYNEFLSHWWRTIEPLVPLSRRKDPRLKLYSYYWSKKNSRCKLCSYWSKKKTFEIRFQVNAVVFDAKSILALSSDSIFVNLSLI